MKTTSAIKEYMSYMHVCGRYSIETLKHYMTYILDYSDFLKFKKAFKIEDISCRMCEKYSIKSIDQLTYDASYKRIIVAKNFHQWLSYKYDYEDLSGYFVLPQRPKRLPVFCNHEEIEAITEYYDNSCDDHILNKTILEMLYGLGVRVSELANLDINKINFNDGILSVVGKGDKERIIPIPYRTLKQMEVYLNQVRSKWNRRGLKYFLVNRLGNQLTIQYIGILVKSTVSSLNIQKHITPHKIRHTYATHLMEGNADIRTIQLLLGHSSITSTQIYTHVDLNRMNREYIKAHPLALKSKFNT